MAFQQTFSTEVSTIQHACAVTSQVFQRILRPVQIFTWKVATNKTSSFSQFLRNSFEAILD